MEQLLLNQMIKEAYMAEGLIVSQYLMSQSQEEEKLLPELEFKYNPEK
jgi:hypothetical protein